MRGFVHVLGLGAVAVPLLAASPAPPATTLAPSFPTATPNGMLNTSLAPNGLDTLSGGGGVPGPATSFGATLAHSDGYISTGVGTGGAAGVDAGVTVPIVPGKVTLQAGGGAGQVPVYANPGQPGRTAALRYQEYHAELDANLGDNTQLSLGVNGASLTPPR